MKKYSENELKKRRDDFMSLENLSESDDAKFESFKVDIIDILEEIIETDFAAEPFRFNLTDEVIHQLECLNRYFSGINNYFHLIKGDRLMFNNHPLEKLEE